MNNDLISREALKKALKSNCKPEICHDYKTAWCEKCCQTNDFEDLIDNAPTVWWCENCVSKGKCASTRPQGEWIDRIADKGYVECPFCHKQITGGDLNFCVKCGAKMKGGA